MSRKTYILGHLNPDTDSICAAIAYADFKSRTEGGDYIPARAGAISAETRWVLDRFGLKDPELIEDVSPQVKDCVYRRVESVSPDLTVKQTWAIMRDGDISTLPITDEEGRLKGIIAMKDLSLSLMDSLDRHAMSKSKTPFKCIAETLEGKIITGDPEGHSEGHIFIGAGLQESIKKFTRPGDISIVANRTSTQTAALEAGAACLVVCLNPEIDEDVIELAKDKGATIIVTPYDTFKAAFFINQSVRIGYYMKSEGLITFTPSTPLEDVLQIMGNTRFIYFPVVDEKGKYLGLISRRNILSHGKKSIILVDHNEKTQCVSGWEEADVKEIVDHHRVGGMQTLSPIFFRNQPLGSTCSIISLMYKERGLEIPKDIAGALLSAIISDTLLFKSPTCTETDKAIAAELAEIAGVNTEDHAGEMFSAGESLTGKTAKDVLHQDFKIFKAFEKSFGVSQSMFMSQKNLAHAAELTGAYMNTHLSEEGIDYAYYLLTDIQKESSTVICAGEGAENALRQAFGLAEDAPLVLKGVVSRKKQFIPSLMEELKKEAGKQA